MRTEISTGIQALGVLPLYPMQENVRIGQVWIEDASVGDAAKGLPSGVPTSLRVSDQLVGPVETRRKSLTVTPGRLDKSGDTLVKDILGTPTGVDYFKQSANDSLAIAALPKYSLASVDQASFSGSGATPFASLLGSLGFSRSEYLTVEAAGIEIADLPLDELGEAVQGACTSHTGIFGDPIARNNVQRAAFGAMAAWWQFRQTHGGTTAPFQPQIVLLRRVFYLRGIRYIFHDSKAAALALSAAFNPRLAAGVTPPATPSQPAIPAAPVVPDQDASLKAEVDALTAQVAAIKTNLPANSNLNLSVEGMRATAAGIEMIQLFERPIAFGYEPLAEALTIDPDSKKMAHGVAELCADFGAPVL
jgi:hypothetical protein